MAEYVSEWHTVRVCRDPEFGLDFEVEHLESCPMYDIGTKEQPVMLVDCEIGHETLFYGFERIDITEPGVYRVRRHLWSIELSPLQGVRPEWDESLEVEKLEDTRAV